MRAKECIKVLAKGRHPGIPLVIPLVFSLAAKAEGIPPKEFFYNATKIANSLYTMHRFLGGDGVVVEAGTSFLETEAVGCELDWSTFPPKVTEVSAEKLRELAKGQFIDVQKAVRLSIISDTIRRLKITLRDESALVVILTGPWSLAIAWSNYVNPHGVPRISESLLESASSVILQIAREFCKAGIDIVILKEDILPTASSPQYASWESALLPVCNIIRFHEALPVVLVKDTLEDEQIKALSNTTTGFMPCFGITTLDSLRRLPSDRVVGLGMPPQLLTNNTTLQLAPALLRNLSQNLALITTDGEIPYETDISLLPGMTSTLQAIRDCLG